MFSAGRSALAPLPCPSATSIASLSPPGLSTTAYSAQRVVELAAWPVWMSRAEVRGPGCLWKVAHALAFLGRFEDYRCWHPRIGHPDDFTACDSVNAGRGDAAEPADDVNRVRVVDYARTAVAPQEAG